MVNTSRLDREIIHLADRYNGDNDIIPNAPVVTYADYILLVMVSLLSKMVADLQQQINELQEADNGTH